MSKVVRVMGYSPNDEESNPVMKDFTKAFRNYKRKSRLKPMKPNFLDYVVFSGVIIGIILILFSFFAGGNLGILGGIIIAIAFLSEIVSIALH